MTRYEERQNTLQQIFQDTLECIDTNAELKQATEAMANSTIIYTDEICKVPVYGACSGSNIEVVEDTTFSCARKQVGSGKVAALNFANAVHPGGGVAHGALASWASQYCPIL